ncbi:MAG: hypothetical protein JRD88_04055 [Deltaproteobacteria bacterium]|nr:hypothetical protein [Deltaproteobacteria bacterium]
MTNLLQNIFLIIHLENSQLLLKKSCKKEPHSSGGGEPWCKVFSLVGGFEDVFWIRLPQQTICLPPDRLPQQSFDGF